MDLESTKSVIHDFVSNRLSRGRAEGSLDENLNLLDSGILDSLGIMLLIQFIEERFSIGIADEELMPENFESIGAISKLVSEKRRTINSAPTPENVSPSRQISTLRSRPVSVQKDFN